MMLTPAQHGIGTQVKCKFSISPLMELIYTREERKEFLWLAAGHRKEKVQTPSRFPTLVLYTFSRSFTFLYNQIHLLKMPSMEIMKSIAGIKLPFSFPDLYESLYNDFVFDRAAGLVALRTKDYCIQFFSLFGNFEVSQVQVCERNFQPVDDVMVFVALMALSIDGSMMGTVDVRLPEERLGGLVSLKFWMRGSRDGEYNLSTVIYEPHSDAGISSLAFRPGYSMAVSSSFGGEFKVWVYCSNIQPKDQVHQKSGWRCQSVGSYKKMAMTAAVFSADGSVLAVAAETVVTLWDPDKNALVAVIGDALTPITTLSFIGKSDYLVTLSRGSKPQLAVWDLSKLSILWSYKFFAQAVSCIEDGSQFAILALPNPPDETATRDQDGIILLFDAQNPVSVATWLVKKAKGGGLAFVRPNTSLHHNHMKAAEGNSTSLLVYINGDHEYIIFDPLSREENKISRIACESHLPAEETVTADIIILLCVLGMHQYMGSSLNSMRRGTRFQKFHLFLQKDLGRLYSAGHLMCFHPSRNCAQFFLHPY